MPRIDCDPNAGKGPAGLRDACGASMPVAGWGLHGASGRGQWKNDGNGSKPRGDEGLRRGEGDPFPPRCIGNIDLVEESLELCLGNGTAVLLQKGPVRLGRQRREPASPERKAIGKPEKEEHS